MSEFTGRMPISVLRNVLTRYWLVTSGSNDLRIEYIDAHGAILCDLGELVDSRWKWTLSNDVPLEVEEQAWRALNDWPRALPSYGGTETGDEARANLDAFYDRDIGPDPVLQTPAFPEGL